MERPGREALPAWPAALSRTPGGVGVGGRRGARAAGGECGGGEGRCGETPRARHTDALGGGLVARVGAPLLLHLVSQIDWGGYRSQRGSKLQQPSAGTRCVAVSGVDEYTVEHLKCGP